MVGNVDRTRSCGQQTQRQSVSFVSQSSLSCCFNDYKHDTYSYKHDAYSYKHDTYSYKHDTYSYKHDIYSYKHDT